MMEQRELSSAARKMHFERQEHWCPGDSLWAPGGPRGARLTRGLLRRSREQVQKVMRDAMLVTDIRRALVGCHRRQSECVVESLLTNIFKNGTLLYGTVRRVAERLIS